MLLLLFFPAFDNPVWIIREDDMYQCETTKMLVGFRRVLVFLMREGCETMQVSCARIGSMDHALAFIRTPTTGSRSSAPRA
jgi:hypothetical protein